MAMIDLDAAIRDALKDRPIYHTAAAEEDNRWVHRVTLAIIAVLDEHKHMSAAGVEDPLPDPFPELSDEDSAGGFSVSNWRGIGFGCTRCHYEAMGCVRDYGWCLTLRGIARELGIEVPQ